MKKTRRLLALLLAMVMMLALTVTAGAEEVTTTAAKSEITVIYTNDVHTYIDKTLSYATVSAMKQDYQKAGKQVLLVDAGDHIQGTAYGGMDEGKTIVQLMNAAGYDLPSSPMSPATSTMRRTALWAIPCWTATRSLI